MAEISQLTQELIQRYQNWYQAIQRKETVSTIHVDEVASKVAAFYEKLRGIIDWREEHLMKRAAIERNLRRRLLLAKDGKSVAEPLVLELIRGGHFPNDRIEESKILVVEKILDKYIYIAGNAPSSPEKQKIQLYNWMLSIAACETEEVLSPPYREKALIEYMMESIADKVKVQQGTISFSRISDEEKNTQIYIAIHRALFKLDSPIITYHLLKRRYPQWSELPIAQLHEITQNIYSVWNELEKELKHPLADKFYNLCERCDTPYLLLGDVLSQDNPADAQKKISEPEVLDNLIRGAYKKRLSTLKSRLYRAAIYATLSVFLTNIFSLLVAEIPLAKLITGSFSPLTIAVDIGGPTFLMFLLMITVKLPSKSNLEIVIMETMKIVYKRREEGSEDVYEIKVPKRRGMVVKFFVSLLYLIGALISVGAIVTIFQLANFPPTSIVINFVFVALIAFTGLAVRSRAEELTVEEKKAGFFGFILDMIFLPLVGVGRWLSNKWKKYNALAIIFSALVDMPFSIFTEFLEQWRYFLKEKKEEIH